MRKDRNTFFSESNMFQANYPQQPMMPQVPISPAPYQQSSAANSFYSGPMPNQMSPTPMAMPNNINQNTSTDIEPRLAKMERQIRRLETRVNKLESTNLTNNYQSVEEIENNYPSSMYMI